MQLSLFLRVRLEIIIHGFELIVYRHDMTMSWGMPINHFILFAN